jgi:hypothetical protein
MSEITAKQTKAITALLSERTTAAAAKAAKISERQLYRWLADPAFCAHLKQAEGQLLDGVTRRLLASVGAALDTLEELNTGAASESVRARVANDMLNQLLRVRELADIEKRLAVLEAANHDN